MRNFRLENIHPWQKKQTQKNKNKRNKTNQINKKQKQNKNISISMKGNHNCTEYECGLISLSPEFSDFWSEIFPV